MDMEVGEEGGAEDGEEDGTEAGEVGADADGAGARRSDPGDQLYGMMMMMFQQQ